MDFRDWLRIQDVKQRELAEILGISGSSVSGKVTGKVAWQPKDLKALHDAYGLSADFVLGFSDAPYGGPTGGSDRKIHAGRRWHFE